jgi:excisionase family DNA binding protein
MPTPDHPTGTLVADELQLYKIPEVMLMLKMSRTVIFKQLRDRRLRSVRQGRARLIPASAVAEYIALLEREEAERAAA